MVKLLSMAAAAGLMLALAGTPSAQAASREAPAKAPGVSHEQATEFSAQRRRYRARRIGPRYRYVRRWGPRYRYARPYYRYRYARPYYYYDYPYYYRPRPYVYAAPFPGFYFGFGPW